MVIEQMALENVEKRRGAKYDEPRMGEVMGGGLDGPIREDVDSSDDVSRCIDLGEWVPAMESSE